MIDLIDPEKVICGLETLHETIAKTRSFWTDSTVEVIPLAISLLKDREPVKPYMGHSIEESRIHFRCGACQQAIDREDRFCRSCGKAVAWDD